MRHIRIDANNKLKKSLQKLMRNANDLVLVLDFINIWKLSRLKQLVIVNILKILTQMKSTTLCKVLNANEHLWAYHLDSNI